MLLAREEILLKMDTLYLVGKYVSRLRRYLFQDNAKLATRQDISDR